MSYQTLKRKPFVGLFPEDYIELIEIPTSLFHPFRLVIMKTLLLHGNVEFRQFRYAIQGITDGNLASHLRVLEKSGYVRCYKEIIDRKPRTSYEITKKGRKAFEELENSLRKMVED